MKALFSRALLWTLTLAVISWPAAVAHAQVRYGSIVVEARDPSGSAVPGADVTITETGTNRSRSGVTNSAGVVTFATIPPGTYSVRVNLTGFKEFVTTDVAVTEDTVMRVSSQLEVGQITETMTVSAAAAILQTDRAEVRTDIPAVQLENLPVPVGRNYQNLFVTVPGISPPENMHSVAVNPARGLAFSSNGTTRNANSIRIEGAISNNLWLPHVAAYVPALEAIESVGVTTSTFDADQGLSGGMSANVLIKSGTNVVSRLRVRVLLRRGAQVAALLPAGAPKRSPRPASTSSAARSAVRSSATRRSSSEVIRARFDRQVANRFGTVPTAAMRNGDFSASTTPIYDPATGAANGSGRTAFPGNIIPRDRFDPIVQKLIAGLPLPNLPGLADNYFATGDYTFDRHNVDAKVNYNPTAKLGIVGRVGWLGYEFRNPPMFGDLGGLPVNSTAAKAGTGLGDTYTFTGSVSHVLSPTFLIDAYLGVTTIEVTSEPDRIDENLGSGYLGIPGTNGTNRLYGGWPHFNITNYSNIGYAGSSHSPYIDDNWQVQYTANATWTKGAHTLKFGGDIVRQAMNRHELGDGSGSFTFGGGPTQIQGGPAGNQFNTIAAFLLGLPTGISKSVIPFENDYTRSRNWQFSFFARDQWQPTRKLTASLGLRYDKFPMGTRTTRGLERYDPDHEPDADLRRRIRADRLRLRHGPRQLVAARRSGLPPHREHRRARRIRHQLRPVSAGVRPQHPRQLPLVHFAERAAAERAAAGRASGGRYPGDHRPGHQQRDHPCAAERQRARAARRAEAGLHPLVERHRAGGAGVGIHGTGRLRRDPAARHQPDHGRQCRSGDRRRQRGPAAVRAIRADRRDRHSQQPGLERLRFTAGLAGAAARERSAGERRVHLVQGVRHLLRYAER